MSSLSRVLAGRAALAAALLSLACQKNDGALFDNSGLDQPGAGSGGSASTGAQSSGGSALTGGSHGAPEGGEGGSANPSGGAGDTSEGGGSSAGSAGGGGKGEEGGSAGSGGSGGTKPDPEPEPVTIELTDFQDSYVNSCADYTNFGDADEIRVDAEAPGNCTYQALLSVALDKIPEGALVSNATLTLTCIDAGGLIDAAYASEAWTQGAVRWNDRPDSAAAIGSMTCEAIDAKVTLDLKAAVVAWLSGDHANHGILMSTETENGTDLVSSEGESGKRPVLSVTYTLPVK